MRNTKPRFAGILPVLAVFGLTALPASAATVTVNFAGQIDFIAAGGAFDGFGVTSGDGFSGSYTYNTAATDSDPTPERGQYNYMSIAPTGMSLTITIGSLTVSTDPANPNSSIRILAFPTFDEYRVNTTLPELAGSSGGLFLDMPINWGGGQITTDALPFTTPDIGLATFNEILINDLDGGQFAGTLTMLEAQPIPLPAAIWLFGSALAGLLGWSRTKT